tara:strand:- start:92 stop:394 length:303 start_codon:yes stop_codon:yes gene_type:complete
MAKTKTKKQEKIVDLKPKAEKITEQELAKVQGVVNSINRSQIEIGMIETRKYTVLKSISVFQEQLSLMQQDFEKEYGTSNIDITNGKINYSENGETDKKD